jgi:hypothetical protein
LLESSICIVKVSMLEDRSIGLKMPWVFRQSPSDCTENRRLVHIVPEIIQEVWTFKFVITKPTWPKTLSIFI